MVTYKGYFIVIRMSVTVINHCIFTIVYNFLDVLFSELDDYKFKSFMQI